MRTGRNRCVLALTGALLSLSPAYGEDILRIAMSGDHPEELVLLVDAVTEAYLQEVVNKEQKKRLERLDQLKELYNRAEDSLLEFREVEQGATTLSLTFPNGIQVVELQLIKPFSPAG